MDPHNIQVADIGMAVSSRHNLNGSNGGPQDLDQTLYQLEALDLPWQLFLVILYSLTAIVSFILNIITVVVLIRGKQNTSELRKYLINLSVSDLLMSCFSIPFTYTEYMLGRWIFPAFMCPIVRFVVTLSVFVSVATMTVIGINRHMAIMYPFKKSTCPHLKIFDLINKSVIIALVWLVGLAISLPEYLMFTVEPFPYNNGIYYECRQLWPDEITKNYTICIFFITFAIPLLLLCYLYSRICMKIWKHQMPGNADVIRDNNQQIVRVKVIRMLAVVVIVFAVFWLPIQTFSLIMWLYPEIRQGFVYKSASFNIFVATYFTCHWLSMAHSCLNPLIYCFMNDNFKSDLKSVCIQAIPGVTTSNNHNNNNNNNGGAGGSSSNGYRGPRNNNNLPTIGGGNSTTTTTTCKNHSLLTIHHHHHHKNSNNHNNHQKQHSLHSPSPSQSHQGSLNNYYNNCRDNNAASLKYMSADNFSHSHHQGLNNCSNDRNNLGHHYHLASEDNSNNNINSGSNITIVQANLACSPDQQVQQVHHVKRQQPSLVLSDVNIVKMKDDSRSHLDGTNNAVAINI